MHTSVRELDLELPGADAVFIAGEWRKPAAAGVIDVISPSTENLLIQVARPSPADADAAVAAARDAFDNGPWPRMPVAERTEIVSRFCDALESAFGDLNRAWAHESGAPLKHGVMMHEGASTMAWRAAVELAPELPWEQDRGDAVIRREPTGTVLAILTNNGPVPLMAMKVIPALLAGCPVVVKHAPESQLTAHLIAEASLQGGFPPGVLSFLPADTEVTQYLVSHPGIDMVTVTGSQAIARDILNRTTPRLARTALELGGKSPAILTEDVDLDEVMTTLAEGSSSFMGQICVLLSRIIVPRSRYSEVENALVDYYTSLTIGDPFDPATDRGPLSVERARTRTEAFVAGAVSEGARVACGGKRPEGISRGYYYEPTLLADVDNQMTVAQEEVFGPVACLIAYDDIEQAIDIANDTPYGLAAAVYSKETSTALDIARRIRSGSVGVNVAGMSLSQPFGGVKQSGWGRECGPEGILEFTDMKQMLVAGGSSFLNQ
ncbi:aldehyde dehydrogenase family protein [Rhodococcus sp. ACS1]|uniref:aldehyde dehydrogenase family protein n=1 Tax=Rhodococcus sp. ACS1 TaxID=2028570 RepID=UPI0015CE31FD|nr:aldehyde dehydrogenase family protein [Rhodococcus sp. ACS1]